MSAVEVSVYVYRARAEVQTGGVSWWVTVDNATLFCRSEEQAKRIAAAINGEPEENKIPF